MEQQTAIQLVLALASASVWLGVFIRWRERLSSSIAGRLFIVALLVGLVSEFIPLAEGVYIGNLELLDILRGLRSGVLLILGIALFTVAPDDDEDDDEASESSHRRP